MHRTVATAASEKNPWASPTTGAASRLAHQSEPLPALGFLVVITVSAIFWGGVGLILWTVW